VFINVIKIYSLNTTKKISTILFDIKKKKIYIYIYKKKQNNLIKKISET
jgi:hypothetical protein